MGARNCRCGANIPDEDSVIYTGEHFLCLRCMGKQKWVKLATDALQVQNACNPSGVANGMYRAVCDLRELLGSEGGTDALRVHPITQLWAAKLADLCGLQYTWPREAERAVEQIRDMGRWPFPAETPTGREHTE